MRIQSFISRKLAFIRYFNIVKILKRHFNRLTFDQNTIFFNTTKRNKIFVIAM